MVSRSSDGRTGSCADSAKAGSEAPATAPATRATVRTRTVFLGKVTLGKEFLGKA
ncbi:hypothetical protein GCM10023220_33550 [Streptomyces ziwulingensis]|uniref:Uncharacterized protein n=1 Tax=Streptomyces ziwulingensis TaxID=1045501 RepID=A0ABP9C0Q3_9ACTN